MQPLPNLALLAPDTIFHARYRVVRGIAAGGMGAVYEVMDEVTQRTRALKVMLPDALDNAELRARFAQEARITGGVESDHIVQVSDAGVDADSGMPFLVMDLLRGEDLRAHSARVGPLPPDDVVLYLRQVALALDKTHAAGIVHRDLKPENLFLTRRDDGSPCVKILDFGVAKLSVQSSLAGRTALVGTPLYMAPEQIRGDGRIDHRADLYALGHIAYTLLAGGAYWMTEAKTALSIFVLFQRILAGLPEAPSLRATRQRATLPPGFDTWFARATALLVSDRFDRATTAIALLVEALQAPSAPRTPVPPPAGGAQPAQRAEPKQDERTYNAGDPLDGTEPVDRGRPAAKPQPRRGSSDPAMKVVDAPAPAPVPVAPAPVPQRRGSDAPIPEERADKAGRGSSAVAGLVVTRSADRPLLFRKVFWLIYTPTYVVPSHDDGIAFSHTPAAQIIAQFRLRTGQWYFRSNRSLDLLNGERVVGEVPLKAGDQLWIQIGGPIFAFKFINDEDALRSQEAHYKAAAFDALTRAYSRWYLKRALTEEHRRAGKLGRNLSLLMLDIKPIEGAGTTLDQTETDPLLIHLARIARTHMPEGGLLGRLNSDTLVILLPGLKHADAAALARKLGQEARDGLRRFPQAARAKVRVSVAHRQPSDAHEHQLLDRAACALYTSGM